MGARLREEAEKSGTRCHGNFHCLHPTPALTGQHLCLYQLLHNLTIKSVRQGLEQQTVSRGVMGSESFSEENPALSTGKADVMSAEGCG